MNIWTVQEEFSCKRYNIYHISRLTKVPILLNKEYWPVTILAILLNGNKYFSIWHFLVCGVFSDTGTFSPKNCHTIVQNFSYKFYFHVLSSVCKVYFIFTLAGKYDCHVVK